MKLFTYILSFYILVLIAVPCNDVSKDNTLQKVELSQNTTGNHQNEKDHCPPFCACNCCVTPIIYQGYIIQFYDFSFSQKLIVGYVSTYSSSLFDSIWQPPKLS
jgi:hypothetical protein